MTIFIFAVLIMCVEHINRHIHISVLSRHFWHYRSMYMSAYLFFGTDRLFTLFHCDCRKNQCICRTEHYTTGKYCHLFFSTWLFSYSTAPVFRPPVVSFLSSYLPPNHNYLILPAFFNGHTRNTIRPTNCSSATQPTAVLRLSIEVDLWSPMTKYFPSGTWYGRSIFRSPFACSFRYGSSSGSPLMLTYPVSSISIHSPGNAISRFYQYFIVIVKKQRSLPVSFPFLYWKYDIPLFQSRSHGRAIDF